MSGPIRAALVADHRRLGSLLAKARLGDGASYPPFRGGLLRHIGIEEKIVLPALRAVGCEPPVARQLKLDHAALVAMLVPTPTPDLLARIFTLLELHDPLEEGKGGIYSCADEHVAAPAAIVLRIEEAAIPPMTAHFDGQRAHASIEHLLTRAAEGRAMR